MTNVKLNFINKSNDTNNSEIVIFQKNTTPDFDAFAVAWTVIKNCGQGDNHPFIYPSETYVSASDSYGNFTPHLLAEPGQSFAMKLTPSGDELEKNGSASSPKAIEIANDLSKGAINALVFKDGKLLASKTGIAPGQKAVFEFKPALYIGVTSQIEEGQVIDSAVMSEINTEISLLGISSADIVMTGGGPGPNSEPFQFTLQNVQMA